MTAEKCIRLILQWQKNFVYTCIITEQTVICLLMVKKFTNFKAKDSEIVASPLCLGNISKVCLVGNMKKNWI